MARVILYGAPAAVLSQGDVPGHDLIRIAHEDGRTDSDDWVAEARSQFAASYSLDADWLRAVVLRFSARPTAGVLTIREAMEARLMAEGTRLVLAVPGSELTWTEAAIAANPSRIRTYATTPAGLRSWIDAHTWPVPLNPALGGTGRRIGGGRHAPWSLCVTDPTPDPRES